MPATSEPTPEAAAFGARVRDLRTERGWSQIELWERSGLHFTFISRIERGQQNVTLRTILALADALGVQPEELVRGLGAARDSPPAGD